MRYGLFILLLSIFLIFTSPSSADVPPMEIVDISFADPVKHPELAGLDACMLVCANETPSRDFLEGDPSGKLKPELKVTQYDPARDCYWMPIDSQVNWFICEGNNCRFVRYRIPETFKIAVFLPNQNKTFISNEIVKENYFGEYQADLSPNGSMSIKETTPYIRTDIGRVYFARIEFISALLITLLLELLVALKFLEYKRIPVKRRFLLSLLAANLISLPLLWNMLLSQSASPLRFIPLLELFAILFEAAIIYAFNKQDIKLLASLALSVLMNLASWTLGMVLLEFFLFLFHLL